MLLLLLQAENEQNANIALLLSQLMTTQRAPISWRGSLELLLSHIRFELERETLREIPISPEERLAIALYRFGRGDYCYIIKQMTERSRQT